MKVLLTGASSFTGHWFARALAAAGHEVVAVFQGERDKYAGIRARRVAGVAADCRPVWGCSFGDGAFLELAGGEPWDLLCHHAADVTDYRSPDFDYVRALASNTRRLDAVLEALRERGARGVVLTGSLFEPGEGAGSDGLRAFSPYGLSKGLTAQVFRDRVPAQGLALGKFVIPNPFGPLEELRFTAYLVRTWFAGETPVVRTPAYVRDNVHVSLLARAYARFAAETFELERARLHRLAPSGLVGTQGEFALRFARELEPRLGIPCPVELAEQTEFDEPRVRINTDALDAGAFDWDESTAWDAIADWYRETRGGEPAT